MPGAGGFEIRKKAPGPPRGRGFLGTPRPMTTTGDVMQTMLPPGFPWLGSPRRTDSSPRDPRGGADASTCPPRHPAGSEQAGKGKERRNSWITGPSPAAASWVSGLGTRSLRKLGTPAGRIPTVAFAWKFMQERPGSETDCSHLFLRATKGPCENLCKGSSQCQV